uniref:Helicase C-terminal domain-containing protein n=2 Tax=Mesocestoides corti TaxID=53468 RepID=A0A5K3FAE4_MESCO
MCENEDREKLSVVSLPISDQSSSNPKTKIIALLKNKLNSIQLHYHEFLAELTYLQSGGLLTDFDSWRRKRPQELMHALCSGHLDSEDLNKISDFMSGNLQMHEMFPVEVSTTQVDDVDEESDDDIDGILDETLIPVVVRREVETLKRVLEFKRLGLWSRDAASLFADDKQKSSDNKPSLSSLAAPPELTRPKDHLDYLFAELRWLAEDFKKERHWKKVSAKKLAYAALKVFKEKAERSQKAEREEIARIRKQCSLIARMVRDWWRQMDKIVQTKQKARLTARHQQAMSTHLGHVIETTERYTLWLTEGITGAKKPQQPTTANSDTESEFPDKGLMEGDTPKKNTSVEDSDVEFEAEIENSSDDEETIAKEEEMARQEVGSLQNESDEIAALCAEAEASIDELLPPGYLEHLQGLAAHVKEEENDRGTDPSPMRVPNEDGFKQESPEHADRRPLRKKRRLDSTLNTSTEKTALNAESEAPENYDKKPLTMKTKEVSELKAEADMSINELLARYGLGPEQLGNWKGQQDVSESSAGATSTGSDSASDTEGSDTSSTKGSLSAETDKDEVEELGIQELLSENEAEDQEECQSTLPPDPQLKAITDEAMSAQPQGNTLASVAVPVKTPFLLSGTLREYQIVGLSWLVAIYEKRLNGILADEMGLGKTIQTIALLAHLACELGIWGPHLIVVPTSVILNWEVEFKKWCPGFKILTYFGSAKERKAKRKGWTKTNAFHVCITSYRLAIQDSSAFKRKKWKYLILDEAQNIKNFKSQRWQTLLTFNSQRRLLLTGTPLQNSLMELWSLMHFLMPNIFQSHREFQEWFASPLTGMIEGNDDYNEQLVLRLHKVLRPFLLRRLKEDVERQMPKKYEHVILCRLSKRQRYLYDDFMSLSTTKDTLASGQFLSVMNILMQLRKVCNHPNLFEPRPITSPFHMEDDEVHFELPRLIAEASHPFLVAFSSTASPSAWTQPCTLDWLDRAGTAARLLGQTASLAEMARDLPGFVARRVHDLQATPGLISVVENSDPVDSVSRQRNFFTGLKRRQNVEDESHLGRRRQPPVFLPRSVVFEVNEEVANTMGDYYPPGTKIPYPTLPRPVLDGTAYIPTQRRTNHWDAGIPKGVLRSRQLERHNRLSFISRVNERRCTNLLNCSPSFDSTSMLTPDLVYLLTSAIIRRPVSKPCRFATGSWVSCQQALRTWPDKRACSGFDGPPNYCRHPVDVIGCLNAVGPQATKVEQLQAVYGPEASFAVRAVSSSTLRQMLFSPADCLNYFADDLSKFLITTPSAVSSGIRLHVSCPRVHRCETQQEAVFESLLRPFLDSAGVFSHCSKTSSVHRKATVPAKTRCPCTSLTFRSWLMPAQLHQVSNSHCFQFPDPRLIQYDCGKLQRLDLLLRELYADDHRVLIFTQMARMLDILEQFLAYHGYRYLRLDGTTKVEQRQVLMERFNMDSRIFIFILSTRSGGLGINLTGADTVIFYDSDWNPTMDAQAQDRCHRIGQTRDVHIYRLISERTVEENILRKANQKRLLSDVAIEGGKFTTAFFKQSIISDLFAEPSGLQDLVQDKEEREAAKAKRAEVVDAEKVPSSVDSPPSPPLLTTRSGRQIRWKGATSILLNAKHSASVATPNQSSITDSQWAAALEACEDDENDRAAAKRALDEAKAELEEFDESKPIDSTVNDDGDAKTTAAEDAAPSIEGSTSDPLARFAKKRQERIRSETQDAVLTDTSPVNLTPEASVERELAEFESLLRPIERFGVNHLESFQDDTLNLELEQVEAQIEESKKEWKLKTLKALHEAEEERAELEEDEILYCDPNYDPEAARLAELDELERAEEMEEAERGFRGRRGRGAGHFRGRGPRVRGGVTGAGRGSVRRVDNERPVHRVPSERSIRSRDSDASGVSSSTTAAASSRFRHFPPSSDADDLFTDKAAWFHARIPESSGSRRRAAAPVYADWEEDAEDEPEATDIWSPSNRRALSSATVAGPPSKRGRGRGRGGRAVATRGKRRFTEQGRYEVKGVGREDDYIKRRRYVTPSMYAGETEDPTFFSPPAEAYARIKQPSSMKTMPQSQRSLVFENAKPSTAHAADKYQQYEQRQSQLYRRRGVGYSSPSPQIHFTSSPFSGPLGASGRGANRHLPGARNQTSSSSSLSVDRGSISMSQHNSKVLSSLMQVAADPMSSPSIPQPPNSIPQPCYEEEVSCSYQPINNQHEPQARFQNSQRQSNVGPQPKPQSLPKPTVCVPMRSANIAPPRQYQSPPKTVPTELTVPVQTLSNGVHSVQPIRQVLGTSGQPVFVITRQMKTTSGEVFHQRITQPVQPPTQFVQVVRRMSQGPSSFQPRGLFVGTAVPPAARFSSPATPPPLIRVANAPTPISTVSSLTRVTSPSAVLPVVNSANPNSVTTLPGRRVIRVVRSSAPNAIRILQPRIPP